MRSARPFGERRLADARLADEQRVVLAAPAQHLNHPLELERAADQRIDLAGGRAGHEIRRIGLERIRVGRRRLDRRRPAAPRDRPSAPCEITRSSVQPVDALSAQEVRRVALLLLQHEHEQAAGVHVLRARHRGVHHRLLNHAVEAERRLRLHLAGPGTGVNALASTSFSCRRSVSTSAPQLARIRRACGSSVAASSRCSSPTVSCRARWPGGTPAESSPAFPARTERCLTHARVPAPSSPAAGTRAPRPSAAWSSASFRRRHVYRRPRRPARIDGRSS